jgi:L-ascorbate metabolism protein UlaG (beta-lactamase superfamily)
MAKPDVALTLIGGPTLLIEVGSVRLLTDPTFDPPGTYQAKDIVLEKLRGPALQPSEIGRIDAVLLSHDQHWDNFDRSGREFAATKTVITTPVGAERLGNGAMGLAPWQTMPLGDLVITAVPARHGPRGIEPISGDVTGFLIGRPDEPGLIYVSGDTVWYEQTTEIARRFRPRLAVLFTGEAKPRANVHVTMDSNDVIEAAHAFAEATIVAIHNDGWRHFTETQSELETSLKLLGLEARFRRLTPGRREVITL